MTHPLKHCDNCGYDGAPPGATVCEYCTHGRGLPGSMDNWRPRVAGRDNPTHPPVDRAVVPDAGALSAAIRQVGGDHYVNLGVQPWDAMESWMSEEEFAGFLRGNVIKYVARCRSKGGLEDLEKARHYLDRLIELLDEADA